MGETLTIIVRLILPLSILRYPLFGGITAALIDFLDFQFIIFLDNGDLGNYQEIDKALDIYYLSLEVYIVALWKNSLARFAALVLFAYRFSGLMIFLITRNLVFLVIFLNLFEFFYLFYLSYKKIFQKDPVTSVNRLLIILLLLLIPKFLHEYFVHIIPFKAFLEKWFWQS